MNTNCFELPFLNLINTPAYVYDKKAIQSNILLLRSVLPKGVDLFYSIKANPNSDILNFLRPQIDGMEVASIGEIKKAVYSGMSTGNIIFVGPGKTEKDLEFAISLSLYCIVAESREEISIINKLAKSAGKKQPIAIRINPCFSPSNAKIKMAGGAKPFGIDEEIMPLVVKEISKMQNVILIGTYIYSGTMITQSEAIVQMFTNCFNISIDCQNVLGSPLHLIGFGGGYGIDYSENDITIDFESVKSGLCKVFSKYRDKFLLDTRFITESGRFLVGNSGFFIVKILYVKMSRGTTYLIVDGGTNFYSLSNGMGKFLRRNPKFYCVRQSEKSKKTQKYTVVGPLCTPSDILLQNCDMPVVQPGDYLIFPNAGAYALTTSPTGFLSHTLPQELLIGNNFSLEEVQHV